MSAVWSAPTQRGLLAISAGAAISLVLLAAPGYAQTSLAAEDNAIRPFRIDVPEEALVDLHRRVAATRWPARKTVTDQSQGVQAVQAPAGLLGIHINMPGTVPPSVVKLARNGEPVPSDFSDVEKAAYASLVDFYTKSFGYADIMNTRPQTLDYALADSPVGMAAFFYDKFAARTYSGCEPERALTRDERFCQHSRQQVSRLLVTAR